MSLSSLPWTHVRRNSGELFICRFNQGSVQISVRLTRSFQVTAFVKPVCIMLFIFILICSDVSYLFVEACRPPGGRDELLQPCLLHSQRGLYVEEDHRPEHVKCDAVKDRNTYKSPRSMHLTCLFRQFFLTTRENYCKVNSNTCTMTKIWLLVLLVNNCCIYIYIYYANIFLILHHHIFAVHIFCNKSINISNYLYAHPVTTYLHIHIPIY